MGEERTGVEEGGGRGEERLGGEDGEKREGRNEGASYILKKYR